MKDFIEKDVSTRRKNYWQESLKSGEKIGFHKPENSTFKDNLNQHYLKELKNYSPH